jgi:hypothetical protein
MPLTLPTSPAPAALTPRIVTARNELRSAFGGGTQRLARKGTRYAFDVEMPPMRYEDALAWGDIEDETDTVVMLLPQPGVTIGSLGDPRINGANQSGSSLALDGFPSGAVVGKGLWLSVLASSRRWLYRTRAAATANSSGQITLPLRTLLRAPHPDNAIVNIATPYVEGFATLSDDALSVGADGLVRLKFSIEERG